jgi:hypothetical protein
MVGAALLRTRDLKTIDTACVLRFGVYKLVVLCKTKKETEARVAGTGYHSEYQETDRDSVASAVSLKADAADGAAASDALEQTDSSKGVEWRSPASGSPTAASPASGGAGSPISSDSI